MGIIVTVEGGRVVADSTRAGRWKVDHARQEPLGTSGTCPVGHRRVIDIG